MSVNSDNLPYFLNIVRNNFPFGDVQNAVLLVLYAAVNEEDAITKLNNLAGRNIFNTPLPSASLLTTIDSVVPSPDVPFDLTATVLKLKTDVENLNTAINSIENTLTTRDAYFSPFTGIVQNYNNSNVPFTLINTPIVARSFGTELSFYQALNACKRNAMNPNSNHYLPIQMQNGSINCVDLKPSEFALQCELILNGAVSSGFGASAPGGTSPAGTSTPMETVTVTGTVAAAQAPTKTTDRTPIPATVTITVTATINGMVTAPGPVTLVPVTVFWSALESQAEISGDFTTTTGTAQGSVVVSTPTTIPETLTEQPVSLTVTIQVPVSPAVSPAGEITIPVLMTGTMTVSYSDD